jgi:hypothetical protein
MTARFSHPNAAADYRGLSGASRHVLPEGEGF